MSIAPASTFLYWAGAGPSAPPGWIVMRIRPELRSSTSRLHGSRTRAWYSCFVGTKWPSVSSTAPPADCAGADCDDGSTPSGDLGLGGDGVHAASTLLAAAAIASPSARRRVKRVVR